MTRPTSSVKTRLTAEAIASRFWQAKPADTPIQPLAPAACWAKGMTLVFQLAAVSVGIVLLIASANNPDL